MHRGHVLQVLGPPDGGVAEHVLRLSEGLIGRGWRVTAAAPAGSAAAAGLREVGAAVHELTFTRAPSGADLRTARELRALDRDGAFDLVHAHSSKAGALVRGVLPRPRRLLYTPHCFAFAASFSARERRLYRLVEQILVPRTGTLIAVSEWERREGERALRGAGRRLAVVHNGVAACGSPRPDPGLEAFKGDRPLVGMVAVLRPQKDPLTLVHAARRLRDRGALGFRVAVVGNGELAGAVDAEIERLGLADDVRRFAFAGTAHAYLAALDLFVLPSRWESFPIGALEAMACGTPVAATRVGGTPEAVQDGRTGRLFAPDDPDALADLLAGLVGDPAGLAALGEAGRRAYEARFTLERMVDAVEALYERSSSRSSA